jgi:tetratricopeptide (TPR) repeat protein
MNLKLQKNKKNKLNKFLYLITVVSIINTVLLISSSVYQILARNTENKSNVDNITKYKKYYNAPQENDKIQQKVDSYVDSYFGSKFNIFGLELNTISILTGSLGVLSTTLALMPAVVIYFYKSLKKVIEMKIIEDITKNQNEKLEVLDKDQNEKLQVIKDNIKRQIDVYMEQNIEEIRINAQAARDKLLSDLKYTQESFNTKFSIINKFQYLLPPTILSTKKRNDRLTNILKELIEKLNKLLEDNPTLKLTPDEWFYKSRAHSYLTQYGEADDAIDKALADINEDDGLYFRAVVNKAWIYDNILEYISKYETNTQKIIEFEEKRSKFYRKAVTLPINVFSNDANSWLERAKIRKELGEHDEMEAALRMAAARSIDNQNETNPII